MKGRVVLIEERETGGHIAALVSDGKMLDLIVDAPESDTTPRPGAIYRALLDRPMKGMGGAFVKLGNGQTGFLRETKGLRPGSEMLVQVNTYAEPGKASPVTTRLLFKSRYAIITPNAPGLNIARRIQDEALRDQLELWAHETMEGADASLGLILRSVCEHADEDAIRSDIDTMRDAAEKVLGDTGQGAELLLEAPRAEELAWRDWTDPAPDEVRTHKGCLDEMSCWEEIEALSSPVVALHPEGSIAVEATRALVAVDVNTGGDTSPAAGLKANFATIRDLPRQLRLRGLGGQIVIDFAPFPKKDRRQIEQSLRAALRADAIETNLVGWTPLGHFELQRKRERRPVSELLK